MLKVGRICLLILVMALGVLMPTPNLAVAEGGGAGTSDGAAKVTGSGHGGYQGRLRVSGKKRRVPDGKSSRSHRTSLRIGFGPVKPHKLTKTEIAAIIAMCRESPDGICHGAPKAKTKAKPSKAQVTASLSAIARTLIVKLQLPDPTPRFGPDPSVNEWKMAAVGYPLWLWTDGPTTVTSTVRAYGVTFTLRADWQSTTFDMGDRHDVTCTSTRPYPSATKPGTRSPVCGYTYQTASLPKGNYQVTATTNWRISWSALGRSGSLPGSHSGTWSLPVGELNALVVR